MLHNDGLILFHNSTTVLQIYLSPSLAVALSAHWASHPPEI